MYDKGRIDLILKLLAETTSIAVVSEVLKAKSLNYSASSWKELSERRIFPALDKAQLSEQDLIEILQSAEEHSRQHVFLFLCKKETALRLIDRARVAGVLKQLGIESLLQRPAVLDQPSVPTIAGIRWKTEGVDTALIVKEVERRTRHVLTSEQEDDESGRIVKTFDRERRRAVNLIRLHRGGLLEIRIASHDSQARDRYKADVSRIWKTLGSIVPQDEFTELSLSKLKGRLYTDRDKLAPRIRFNHMSWRADDDTRLVGYGSPRGDLYDGEGIRSSFEEYVKYDGYCDGSNIFFKAVDGGPSREVHVLLSGQLNEFAITANCSEADYEYVLGQVCSLNG